MLCRYLNLSATSFLYELQLLRATPYNCCIWEENGKLRGKGSQSDKLYQLDCQIVSTEYASVASSRNESWHQCLGHSLESRLKECVHNEFVQRLTSRKWLTYHSGKIVGRKGVWKTVLHGRRNTVDPWTTAGSQWRVRSNADITDWKSEVFCHVYWW